jgi:hypothetical protein
MLEPADEEFTFQGREEDFLEEWLEETKSGESRLKAGYRRHRPERRFVLPDGTESATGRPAWFLPGKFRFCPTCSQTHDASGRDGNRLASLSAEGRSSATTVLVSSVLRWFHEPERDVDAGKRKLLGFTDNRQDAVLQAGHFNDFIFVSLFRATSPALSVRLATKVSTPRDRGPLCRRPWGSSPPTRSGGPTGCSIQI